MSLFDNLLISFLGFIFVLLNLLVNFFSSIGAQTINTFRNIGSFSIFMARIGAKAITPPYNIKGFAYQLFYIGLLSIPVVAITAIFTGAVLALQSYTGFSRFNAEGSIPIVVALSITRELAPVLTGLMVAGRIGASIAAEIGTMKVTDQIDAMRLLSVNPDKYLLAPKIFAGIISLPILTFIADIIGIMGGYAVGVYKLNFNPENYIKTTYMYLEGRDITSGLIKAFFFGLIITVIGCYQGYKTSGGAVGVGRSTTNTVVYSSMLILLVNYYITSLLF